MPASRTLTLCHIIWFGEAATGRLFRYMLDAINEGVLLQKRDSGPNWARWTTKPRTIRAVVCNDVINVVPVSDLHPFRWIDDTLAIHAIAIQCNIAMS